MRSDIHEERCFGAHGAGGWVRLAGRRATGVLCDPTKWFSRSSLVGPGPGIAGERGLSLFLPFSERRLLA